jgi:glycosyltransferase involved in cell wall biosynthesis
LRILFAHNRYLHRGGEDESREQEMSVLRSHGHEVIEYLADNREIDRKNIFFIGLHSVWNPDQYHRIRNLISETQPDILKVDNYFPLLSPSIFEGAKSMGVSTILSVRNYRLVCASGTLFRSGQVCTDCVGRAALPAIRHRCYHNSYLQSSSIVLSNSYGRLRGTWTDCIDHYIAVSETVRRLLISGGFPAEKISVKPNSVFDTGPGDGSGQYAIYVGRLTEEKGILTLLAAWRKVGERVPLKIVGRGPLEDLVQQSAEEIAGVEFLKWRPLAEVCEYLGRAMVLIFPSEWLEPFGRSIVEAYSKGTPVIAADTDPMRDMVVSERTGLTYRVGDSEDLASKVLALAANPERLAQMRQEARERYLAFYSEEKTYSRMMDIFSSVLSTKQLVQA